MTFTTSSYKTRILAISSGLEKQALLTAVDLLKKDHCVAIPTETVYGLAANALSPLASSRIFLTKNRPADNPLIVHVSSRSMLDLLLPKEYKVTESCSRLMDKFWPGPLTLILPVGEHVPKEVTCGLSTVGVRMPNHPIALSLIEACGFPLAAPSANTSGKPSPTTAKHVFDDLDQKVPLIIDGGPCVVGLESTVLDVSSYATPMILRPGGVTLEQIKKCPGFEQTRLWNPSFPSASSTIDWKPLAPGMKYRHYAPNAPLTWFQLSKMDNCLDSLAKLWNEENLIEGNVGKIGILWLGNDAPVDKFTFPKHVETVWMSLGTSLDEAAALLFARLREMDHQQVQQLWVVTPLPEHEEGVAVAVCNRLNKAASHVVRVK